MILYLNKLSKSLAELRRNPTLQNLLALAKEDPVQAFEEINDFAESQPMSQFEGQLWIVGYISGLCAAKVETLPASLAELEQRLITVSDQHDSVSRGQYRRPYQPRPAAPVKGNQNEPDDDGPRYA